ncbi:MAG: hypothetical protein FD123_3184 [Bacteroidetes bacterium]|nr:MAG: hypothetical protein FD123_3184 [Bacteroidota bacterium]
MRFAGQKHTYLELKSFKTNNQTRIKNKFMRNLFSVLTLTVSGLAMVLSSCSNGPGPGGKATITGKIYVQDYNALCVATGVEYYKPDEEVYIIFGDDASYGERVRTGPDGTYMFQYLRPGKYTVYAYSDVCPITGASVEAVTQTIEVTDKKGTVVLPDIVVKK